MTDRYMIIKVQDVVSGNEDYYAYDVSTSTLSHAIQVAQGSWNASTPIQVLKAATVGGFDYYISTGVYSVANKEVPRITMSVLSDQ